MSEYETIFWRDLAPHQEGASNGREIVAGAISVVLWYLRHDPDGGPVDEGDAIPFVAWLEFNARRLGDEAQREYFGGEG